jgi:hypothetical protein
MTCAPWRLSTTTCTTKQRKSTSHCLPEASIPSLEQTQSPLEQRSMDSGQPLHICHQGGAVTAMMPSRHWPRQQPSWPSQGSRAAAVAHLSCLSHIVSQALGLWRRPPCTQSLWIHKSKRQGQGWELRCQQGGAVSTGMDLRHQQGGNLVQWQKQGQQCRWRPPACTSLLLRLSPSTDSWAPSPHHPALQPCHQVQPARQQPSTAASRCQHMHTKHPRSCLCKCPTNT